jgi:Tfp pilus assembly protein PilO
VKAKLSRRSSVFLIIGGDLLLLLLGWMLLVSPQRQTATSIAHATQAAEAQIQEAQRLAQQPSTPANAVPKQPEIRTAALYQLAKAMPATTDMPDVLLELDQVARASGVTVNTITPGGISAGTGFGVLPISISFSGDFYSLTDLLYRLRTLVSVRHGELDASGRLFAVDSVGLSGSGAQLSASVTVNAFVYGAGVSTTPAVTIPAETDTTSTDTTSSTTTPAPSADAAP